MDEPKHDWHQTVAGCLAIILLLGAGILVGRCSAPAAASEPQATLEETVTIGYDFTDNASQALAELDAYLTTVTTPAVPQYRNTTPAEPASTADRWDQLAQCETGGNWAANTGNGFGGGLQFMHQSSYSTWLSFGGGDYAAHPWDASKEQQIAVAEKVLASSGYQAWPGCSRKFGWI